MRYLKNQIQATSCERRVRQFSKDKPYVFRKDEMSDAVVIASYRRHDSPNQNRFYVAEIQYDMDPDSPFPSEEYPSFRKVRLLLVTLIKEWIDRQF